MKALRLLLAACAVCAGGCRSAGESRGNPQMVELRSPPDGDPYPAIPAGETVLRTAEGTVEAIYRYRLIEPPPAAIAEHGARVPLIVFLHGAGERGSDNAAQLKHFAGWCATDELQRAHPCFVLAMQCPSGETWSPIDIRSMRERGELPKFSAEPTRAMRALMQTIELVRQAKPVDQTRIYLTGLSMGGFGAFDLAARCPMTFAAILPICGGGDPSTAELLARVPFCIVHGSDDPVVPVRLSRAMRDAMIAAVDGSREHASQPGQLRLSPTYREYDKVGHDSWTPAYRFGPDGVLDWLFAQRRPTDRAMQGAK